MKKNILIILTLFVCASMNSQTSKTNFGIKSGINLSKYTPDIYISNIKFADYKVKTGFYIGGFTNIEISSKLSIQPELLFSNQGTEVLFNMQEINSTGNVIDNYKVQSEINENSIVLPVVFQYLITQNFNFELGFQLGYIISLKEKIISNPRSQINDNNTLISPLDYDRFDLGFNFGAGYKIHESIRINARYFQGVLERDSTFKPSIISLGIEYEYSF